MMTTSVLFSGCGKVISRQQRFKYELERDYLRITYSGSESREYNFPKIISDDLDEDENPNYTVDWQIQSMETESGSYTAIRSTGGQFLDKKGNPTDFSIATVRFPTGTNGWRFSLAPLKDDGDQWATIIFVANINGSNRLEKRTFEVSMRDIGESEFKTLYSFRHQNLEPYESGLGERRMFGLKDLDKTGAEILSGDTVDLAWRYKEKIALDIGLYDEAGNRLPMPDSVMDIEEVLNKEGVPGTLNLKFKQAGKRILHVDGTAKFNEDGTPDFSQSSAFFEYTYDIRDAINCYTFDQVKAIEKAARLDYILNGVADDPNINPIPANQLSQYYNASAASSYPKMLSRQFMTTGKNPLGADYMAIGGNYVGTIFKEFERWSPSYRYRDIVLRANMQTWAEGTWFFGNVFGNGYVLDATPYAQNSERKYRNVHGNDWQEQNGKDIGVAHEGESFRDGHGWGDKFAFYMLSNNTTIDNVRLIGENIVKPGGVEPLLNEYKTISVLGTSGLAGGAWGFNQGQAWDRNAKAWKDNQYVQNIRVINCYVEKGLILVGANYVPHRERPIVVESCILRYAGFAGIYGRGQDNDQTQRGGSTGMGMGSEVQAYSAIGRVEKKQFEADKKTEKPQRVSLSCGNFVVSKNNIFYDICTSAMLANDDWSGTHYRVLGANNCYFTWVDSLKLVFPIMKIPGGMDKLNITKIASSELARIMNVPAYDDVKLRVEGQAGYFINLPFISVDTFDNNNVVANVVEIGDEVLRHPSKPSVAGSAYYMSITTAVDAGDAGTVFAFSVMLLKNNDIMKTGTYDEQTKGLSNLYGIITNLPKATWTTAQFGF